MDAFALFIGQALIGWLIADLLSGVVHWWLDRVAKETLPIIGQSVVVPNQNHHIDPLKFTRASLWKRNAAMWAFISIVSLLWLLILGPSVTWAVATVGAILVNEIHFFTHQPKKANGFVRVCQEIGIIQSPKHHAGHHKAPQNKNYCSLTDWLNPILTKLDAWGRLERLLNIR